MDYTGKSERDLLIELCVRLEEMSGILEDHEGRMRCLEDNQNRFLGGLVVIGAGFSLIGAKFLGLLKAIGF
jgi:hypothetical protein